MAIAKVPLLVLVNVIFLALQACYIRYSDIDLRSWSLYSVWPAASSSSSSRSAGDHTTTPSEPFRSTDGVEPSRPSLPGFCNVCGPEDAICAKYGRAFLQRSRAFDGAGARVQRLIRAALDGEPTKIAVLGGSVTAGRGVTAQENWTRVFTDWWSAQFPNSTVTLFNGATPGTGTTYFSMCMQEHIPMDADLLITECAINDLGREEEMASFEWTLRRALNMRTQPAIVNVQVFGLDFPRLATGGDYHTSVANFYDTPVISLRNAVLPRILADMKTAPEYFVNRSGTPDFKHINARMHRATADILTHYIQSQLCNTLAEPVDAHPLREDAALSLTVPQMALQQYWGTNGAAPPPDIDPQCASLRDGSKHKLVAKSAEGWEISTQGSAGTFYIATEPGARISFAAHAGVMRQIRLTFMRSRRFGLGFAKCWLDDKERDAVMVDGFWLRYVSVVESYVISSRASPGEHTVWCELSQQTNDPHKRTNFWIVGIDGA